jgi:uncharacterized DUF497 family protein
VRISPKADYDTFEWGEWKREANVSKHGIDFEDARAAMAEPHLVFPADHSHEERWIALVKVNARLVAVVYTIRQNLPDDFGTDCEKE